MPVAVTKRRTRAAEYVAECFWPGVTKGDLVRLGARVRATAGRTNEVWGGVRYRGALLLPADEVVFCFFDGPSAEAVDVVARRAKIPFDRILRSLCVAGADVSDVRGTRTARRTTLTRSLRSEGAG